MGLFKDVISLHKLIMPCIFGGEKGNDLDLSKNNRKKLRNHFLLGVFTQGEV